MGDETRKMVFSNAPLLLKTESKTLNARINFSNFIIEVERQSRSLSLSPSLSLSLSTSLSLALSLDVKPRTLSIETVMNGGDKARR